MNKKEMIIKLLQDMGYRPKVDEDNDVVFNFQLKTVYFSILGDDEPDQSMIMSNFITFDEEDAVKMLIACNKVNREIRHIKVVLNTAMNAVTAFYQFIFTDEETAKENLRMAFELFGSVRSYFIHEVDSLSEEEKEPKDEKNEKN